MPSCKICEYLLFLYCHGFVGDSPASESPVHVKAAQGLAAFCKRLFSDTDSELLEADVLKVFNVDFCLHYSYPRLRKLQKCQLRFYNS